jgi:hypothetical protein
MNMYVMTICHSKDTFERLALPPPLDERGAGPTIPGPAGNVLMMKKMSFI